MGLFDDIINEIKTVYSGSSDKSEKIELVITNYKPVFERQVTMFNKEG